MKCRECLKEALLHSSYFILHPFFRGWPKIALNFLRRFSILDSMTTPNKSKTGSDDTTAKLENDRMLSLFRGVTNELLALGLQRGFHGSVGVEVTIQNGVIQHIRRRLDRLDR